jgi:type VI secretion system secreted protein VgrG
MPDNENPQVFSANNVTGTAKPVPEAGGDSHLSIPNGSLGDYSSVTSQGFVSGQGGGQQQTSVRSDDHTIQVANNQHNIVKGEVVIQSQTNRIYIKASTRIELEVGASKLVMDSEGNITLTGKVIKIVGDTSTEIIAPKNHVAGTTKMDGGDVFIN